MASEYQEGSDYLLYLQFEGRWMKLGHITPGQDESPDELFLHDGIDHKRFLTHLVGSAIVGNEVEFRVSEQEIPEIDPDPLLVHLAEDDLNPIAMCNGEPFHIPEPAPGQLALLCVPCFELQQQKEN